jgi:predicted alpha/beta superfamily hydrolase
MDHKKAMKVMTRAIPITRFLLCFILFVLVAPYRAFSQQCDSLTKNETFPSKIFGRNRELIISLPHEYYTDSNKRFPVVYLFDAQFRPLFNYMQATIRYISGNRSLDPVIIVGIKTTDRFFEFLPNPKNANPFDYNPDPYYGKQKVGGADTLLQSIKNEIAPLIERNYRTLPVRIGLGHSLGGSFLTHFLKEEPTFFNAIIAVSPNYAYDKEQLVHTFTTYLKKKKTTPVFLYLAQGKTSEVMFNQGIEKIVAAANKHKDAALQFSYEVLDVANHSNTSLEGFLRGLLSYHSSIYKSAETIIAYYTKLAEAAGYKLDATQINQLAYDYFMEPNGYKEAIKLFSWGATLYPDEDNLYDSMGDAEEGLNNKEAALAATAKSIAVLERRKTTLDEKTYAERKRYYSEKLERLKKPAKKPAH